MRTALVAMLFLSATISPLPFAEGGVGDLTLRTDHPHYPGEGAFQTVADCVSFATAEAEDREQARAIALFQWMLTHQFHLYSPQEWFVPGKTPGANRNDSEMVVYDANRARFSYAYGLCGTVHAWNEPYWKALGMQPRLRAFPGHVNSEIRYADGWHAFDTDMAGLVLRNDGVVAGYDDLLADPDLVDNDSSSLPRYPFAWPSDFEGMKKGWRQASESGPWYKLYNAGYAAHPGIVHLRAGEAFTRYFDRDCFGGPEERRFWHVGKGGPFRNWTFVNKGEPYHRGADSNCRGDASYCNGVFEYRPTLDDDRFREGIVEESNVSLSPESPRLRSDGSPGRIVFHHFSPYVICGKPLDGVDPMTKPASDGVVCSGAAVGQVRVSVSNNFGQSWSEPREVEGDFTLDLTESCKGRYGWQIRFDLPENGGLDRIEFSTTVQVAQPIYPRLTSDGCRVTYRAASRAAWPVLPDFSLEESAVDRFEIRELRSANVSFKQATESNRTAYPVAGPRTGSVAFRIAAPGRLLSVHAAGRFSIRVPTPPESEMTVEISEDDRQWRRLGEAYLPEDNEFSSGWVYGETALDRVKQAAVRFNLYGGGYPTGLLRAEMYGVYETPPPAPVNLTYAWEEEGRTRTHQVAIPGGVAEMAFDVPTGQVTGDLWVRLAAD